MGRPAARGTPRVKICRIEFFIKKSKITLFCLFQAYFTQNSIQKQKRISDVLLFLRPMYIVWVRKPFQNGSRTQTMYTGRKKKQKI